MNHQHYDPASSNFIGNRSIRPPPNRNEHNRPHPFNPSYLESPHHLVPPPLNVNQNPRRFRPIQVFHNPEDVTTESQDTDWDSSQYPEFHGISRVVLAEETQSQVPQMVPPIIQDGPVGPQVLAFETQTPKRRRTALEVQQDLAERSKEQANKRVKKAARDMEAKAKNAEKLARSQLVAREAYDKPSRFVWSDSATADLLSLVSSLKVAHQLEDSASPGFVAWSRFFKNHVDEKKEFDSLNSLSFDQIERRYKSLVNSYKIIHDACKSTGGEGLHEMLARQHMNHEAYTKIQEMHAHNDGINAVGGLELSDLHNDLQSLLQPVNDHHDEVDEISSSESDISTPFKKADKIQNTTNETWKIPKSLSSPEETLTSAAKKPPLASKRKLSRRQGHMSQDPDQKGQDEEAFGGVMALIQLGQQQADERAHRIEEARLRERQDDRLRRDIADERMERRWAEEARDRARQIEDARAEKREAQVRFRAEEEAKSEQRRIENDRSAQMNLYMMAMMAKLAGLDGPPQS